MTKGDVQTRFWHLVDIQGEDDCWMWKGQKIPESGRGIYQLRRGVRKSATYVAWVLINGPLDDEKVFIRESCGNVGCVNPKHLYIYTDFDRFISFVVVDDESGCWNWEGAKSKSGAGLFSLTMTKIVQAHRYMLEQSTGSVIDSSIFITHSCANNACVNPDHLVIETDEYRFWKYVDKRSDEECWNWLGHTRNTYGALSVYGIVHGAHRYSYELHNGKITDGRLVVRHLCNNRLCVNPNHLTIGTHQDNMTDMVRSNRSAKGERVGTSKLTETNVREIKYLLSLGMMKKKDIAALYKVDPCVISDIIAGRTWSWVD